MKPDDPGINWGRVEELTLALMHLASFEEGGTVRAWKGHSWDVLDRLHERGLISNPASKAKSVAFTEEGARLSRELFERLCGDGDEDRSAR